MAIFGIYVRFLGCKCTKPWLNLEELLLQSNDLTNLTLLDGSASLAWYQILLRDLNNTVHGRNPAPVDIAHVVTQIYRNLNWFAGFLASTASMIQCPNLNLRLFWMDSQMTHTIWIKVGCLHLPIHSNNLLRITWRMDAHGVILQKLTSLATCVFFRTWGPQQHYLISGLHPKPIAAHFKFNVANSNPSRHKAPPLILHGYTLYLLHMYNADTNIYIYICSLHSTKYNLYLPQNLSNRLYDLFFFNKTPHFNFSPFGPKDQVQHKKLWPLRYELVDHHWWWCPFHLVVLTTRPKVSRAGCWVEGYRHPF